MSADPGVVFLSALEQARLIRSGTISSVELVSAYLNRIARLDPSIGSFVTVDNDHALAQAREADSRISRKAAHPPFTGVPISIKDLSETAGLRTTMSSKAYASFVPESDSPIVERIRRAGFVIIGKSNTPEFGSLPVTESELNGRCRNPWDPERTAGGSSGGAAAGVAAGLVPLAHASDGAGSLRIPASCCGVFGFMPGRERTVADRRVRFGPGPVDGVIARSVMDAVTMLDAVCSRQLLPQQGGAGPPARRLRIAVTAHPPIACQVDPECVDAAMLAARILQDAGHEIEEVVPDWRDQDMVTNFRLARQTIAVSYGDPDDELLDRHTRDLQQLARGTSALDLHRALVGIRSYAWRVAGLWDAYDALLTPTLARLPVEHGWLFAESDAVRMFRRAAEFSPFAPIANVIGAPSVSVPVHWSRDGLPVGVQLITTERKEIELVRMSLQLEEARPWADRWPSQH
jgi:Asp-tRNA(Asn)/Glu-tRNA(Gln) amidotransferase A subunit family amidase